MRLRWLLVGLIVVATGAFVVGVALERNSEEGHDEAAEVKPEGSGEATEGGEGEAGHEEGAESADESASGETASAESAESGESVLGVDLESTPLVVLAALGSLALAAGVWVSPRFRLLLAVVGVVMVAFAALDVREVALELDEDRAGLALLAGVVASLHLAAAALAALAARASPDGAASSEP